MRTGYRSSYYYSSNDPFSDPMDQQEDDVNVFENLKDFYEYTRIIDFEGWISNQENVEIFDFSFQKKYLTRFKLVFHRFPIDFEG